MLNLLNGYYKRFKRWFEQNSDLNAGAPNAGLYYISTSILAPFYIVGRLLEALYEGVAQGKTRKARNMWTSLLNPFMIIYSIGTSFIYPFGFTPISDSRVLGSLVVLGLIILPSVLMGMYLPDAFNLAVGEHGLLTGLITAAIIFSSFVLNNLATCMIQHGKYATMKENLREFGDTNPQKHGDEKAFVRSLFPEKKLNTSEDDSNVTAKEEGAPLLPVQDNNAENKELETNEQLQTRVVAHRLTQMMKICDLNKKDQCYDENKYDSQSHLVNNTVSAEKLKGIITAVEQGKSIEETQRSTLLNCYDTLISQNNEDTGLNRFKKFDTEPNSYKIQDYRKQKTS